VVRRYCGASIQQKEKTNTASYAPEETNDVSTIRYQVADGAATTPQCLSKVHFSDSINCCVYVTQPLARCKENGNPQDSRPTEGAPISTLLALVKSLQAFAQRKTLLTRQPNRVELLHNVQALLADRHKKALHYEHFLDFGVNNIKNTFHL
jgi:hypothetical protein